MITTQFTTPDASAVALGTTHLSNIDAFAIAMGECGLIPAAGLERARAFRKAFPGRGSDGLVTYLVEQKFLTRFQADILARGEGAKLVLPSFTLVDVIGSGSMGTVYRARGNKDGAWYAVKIVPRRNVINLNTIAQKIKALEQVRHPRVSALVHVGAQGDRVYMAWPLLEGGEKLDTIITRQGRLPPRQAAQVALQIGMGLQAYHEHDLFHGLLKPNDILIGTDRRVRILDFGVGFLLTCERGKSLLDTTTNNKALARGIDCASPESIMDPLNRTAAGDQYSLGCILYYCLAGRYPFEDVNPVKKMLAHQFSEPTPIEDLVPECPPLLVQVLERLMRKQPEERFADISEAVSELQAVTSDTRPPVPLPAAQRKLPSTPIPAPAVVPSAPRATMKQPAPAPQAAQKPAAQKPAAQKPAAQKPAAQKKAKPAASSSKGVGKWLTVVAVFAGAAVGVVTWLLMRN
jgi:serine/threonine-protein kinase